MPLPLTLLQLTSLWPALLAARQKSLAWNPSLQDEADLLLNQLENAPLPRLHQALSQEALHYYSQLQESARAFSAYTPPSRPAMPISWREGSTQVLDYSAGNPPKLLIVPSLINRFHILDLAEDHSFLRFLSRDIACQVIDWGEPGEAESGYGIEAYTTRLFRILNALEQPVILAGYCMGGMMAMAAAQHLPHKVKALALFATPWDFHASDVTRFSLNDTHITWLETLLQGNLPKTFMQTLFTLLYLPHIQRKYHTTPTPHALAIEHWANDGVAVTSGVAKDCLIHWGYHNTPQRGQWRINSTPIIPAIRQPSYIAHARYDRIVPYGCTRPLIEAMPTAAVNAVESGHVGMIAGEEAEMRLWQGFGEWASQIN